MAIEFIAVTLSRVAGCECSSCKVVIATKSYVRDLSTGLVYHNPWCLEVHIIASTKAIEAPNVEPVKEDFYR